jgi:hypothetical protein
VVFPGARRNPPARDVESWYCKKKKKNDDLRNESIGAERERGVCVAPMSQSGMSLDEPVSPRTNTNNGGHGMEGARGFVGHA